MSSVELVLTVLLACVVLGIALIPFAAAALGPTDRGGEP